MTTTPVGTTARTSAISTPPGPAVVGWPDALRLSADSEAVAVSALPRLERAVTGLLACGHEVLEGVGLAVRLRITDVDDPPDAGDPEGSQRRERYAFVAWPPGSPGIELLGLEDLADAGPALDSERDVVTVDCGDLTTSELWSAVTGAALGLGIRSVLAVPIIEHGAILGSIVLYGTEIRGQSPCVVTGRLAALAAHIAVLRANEMVVLASNRTIAQLRDAMLSRSIIEQAKGVLMAREKIDADTAWQYLVRISQRTHRKLRDISSDIVGKASSGSY